MRKFLLVITLSLSLFACKSGDSKADKEKARKDSIAKVDSIAVVDSIEAVIKDSLLKMQTFDKVNDIIYEFFNNDSLYVAKSTIPKKLDYAKLYASLPDQIYPHSNMNNIQQQVLPWYGIYPSKSSKRTYDYTANPNRYILNHFNDNNIYNVDVFFGDENYYRNLLKDPLYIEYKGFPTKTFKIWYTELVKEHNKLLADTDWKKFLRKKEIVNKRK